MDFVEQTRRDATNQFGAFVPTETTAIHNIAVENKPRGGVDRNVPPPIELREKAARTYAEAIKCGMSAEEALSMSVLETGIDENFKDRIPVWAERIGLITNAEEPKTEKRDRRHYDDKLKKKMVAYYAKYREENPYATASDSMKATFEKFGVELDKSVFYRWIKQYTKSKPGKKASVTLDTVNVVARPETAPPIKCEHCGRELFGSDFVFCPYCGNKMESKVERMTRMCREVAEFLRMINKHDYAAVVDGAIEMIAEGK